jgi:hypothetical protein
MPGGPSPGGPGGITITGPPIDIGGRPIGGLICIDFGGFGTDGVGFGSVTAGGGGCDLEPRFAPECFGSAGPIFSFDSS